MKFVQALTVATIVFLPFYVVRWQLFGVPITLLEAMILITFFTWLGWLVKSKNRPLKGLNPYLWPMVFFLLAGLISIWISPDKRGALGIFKAYLLEPILFYFIVIDLSARLDSSRWIIKSLVLSGVWLALLSIWQIMTHSNPFAPAEIAQGRVSAVFNSANSLALYLGPIWALTVGSLWYERGRERLLYFLLFILFLIVFYFTHSRGAWLGLAGIGVVFFLWWFHQRLRESARRWFSRALKAIVLLLITGGVYFFFNISTYAPDYQFSYPRKTDDTVTIRLCVWEGTKQLLTNSPIFGAGLDGFHSLYPQYRTCDNEPLTYPHNIFLNFWAEMGLLGLMTFLGLVWVAVKKILERLNTKEKAKEQILLIATLSGFVYLFIHGLVDVPYFKNDLSVEFWLLLALAVLPF